MTRTRRGPLSPTPASAGPEHRIWWRLRAMTIALCGTASLCAAGCRLMYLPPSAQAPLFTHGGEVSAAALSGSEVFEGQIAYSPIDHIGVLGSVMYDRVNSGTTINRYRYADLQAEYYIPSWRGMNVEIIGGVGRGDSRPSGTQSGEGTYTEGTFYRYLLQGNIGYSSLNGSPSPDGGLDDRFLFEFAAVMRVAYVRFDRLDETVYGAADDQGVAPPPVVTHFERRGALVYEPALILRAGIPLLQGELQLGFANSDSSSRDFAVNPVYMALGVRMALR